MRKGVALTDAEIHQTIDAYQAGGGNIQRAAERLGLSWTVVNQRILKFRNQGRITKEQEAEWRSRESFHAGRRIPQTSDEAYALLDDFIGRSVRKMSQRSDRDKRIVSHGNKRIVIASDFHAPFHCPESVAELIHREAAQTDTLIIAGDFTDSYAYSRFVRFERISAEAEWAACDALLAQLSKAFREVLCIAGNHDMRLERHLRAQLSPDVMFAIEQLTGGLLDPFQAIAKRYPNVRFVGHQVGRHGVGWFAQFGDVLVSHAERFSRVPGSVLRSVTEWFRDQHDVLGLQPWRVFCQAHTHQLGAMFWESDKFLCETGCMCATHAYQLQPKVTGRPQRRGYVALTQDKDGHTDINSIRLVWLDALRKTA